MQKLSTFTNRELTVLKAIWALEPEAITKSIRKYLAKREEEPLTPQAVSVYTEKLKNKNIVRSEIPDGYHKLFFSTITKETFLSGLIQSLLNFWELDQETFKNLIDNLSESEAS